MIQTTIYNYLEPDLSIESTIEWNQTRGNTPDTFDISLEIAMLKEELNEFIEATTDVDRFDALLDLKFVLIGTLSKMGLDANQIRRGYSAVLGANNTKSKSKNAAGKITKPVNFIGPEAKLQAILDERQS